MTILWGAGGAMMAWRLACERKLPSLRWEQFPPIERCNLNKGCFAASAEFYRIIDRAEAAAANRETLTWANGHNTVKL